NQGTIMSYCHTCWGGMRNIVMRFHERSINEEMLPYMNVAPCPLVVAPPAVADHPQDRSVCEGQEAVFLVLASGDGELESQWRHDGVEIPGATGHILTTAAASTADAGAYDCVISNACGEATSEPAMLSVT